MFRIVHELPGRLRARASGPLSRTAAEMLCDRIADLPGVAGVRINCRTGSVLVAYAGEAARRAVCETLGKPMSCTPSAPKAESSTAPVPDADAGGMLPAATGGFGGWGPLLRYVLVRPLLPFFLRAALSLTASLPFLRKGLAALLRGRLNVDVLDAAAVGVSLLRRDFRTASLLSVLLGFGDVLAAWTRKKSMTDLARHLALEVDTVWVRRDGQDMQTALKDVGEGDLVVVRSGAAVPVDGIVESGEALVNQASMTGESLGVYRSAGSAVFAGSVLEEGELCIRPTGVGDGTRLRQIVRFIENSESLKARVQSDAERLADRVVPFSFLLAGLVWLVTRNPARAASVLLVDYSCALRLATPLAVLSAMREGSGRGVLVKGGRFLEVLAGADTVVFDKTGTLTAARPETATVVPAPGRSREDVLRLAACLEEHFPHPVARAVVRKAEEERLCHAEEHTEVEYVVAHGVASRLHGMRVCIGSRHFIHNDEGVPVDGMETTVRELSDQGLSLLYLAINGELAGVLGIRDPLRPDAAAVVDGLRALGIRRIVMLTGDADRTAAAVAAKLGIDEYRAQVLPGDKAEVIRELQAGGHTVVMVGDGINDSPALSAADVGVALREGADLAREVADVVLTDGRLSGLLTARILGRNVLKRIRTDFAAIMLLNSAFLGAGLLGLLAPGAAAVLHNVTTVGVAFNAVRPMLPPGGNRTLHEES